MIPSLIQSLRAPCIGLVALTMTACSNDAPVTITMKKQDKPYFGLQGCFGVFTVKNHTDVPLADLSFTINDADGKDVGQMTFLNINGGDQETNEHILLLRPCALITFHYTLDIRRCLVGTQDCADDIAFDQ